MRNKYKVIVACQDCKKEATQSKERSNANWSFYEKKPCEFCGGKLTFALNDKD